MEYNYRNVLAILNDDERELEHDACWNALATLEPDDVSFLPVLQQEIIDEGTTSEAKLWSLRAMSYIDPHVSNSYIHIITALKDDNNMIRERSAKLLGKYQGEHVQDVVAALARSFRQDQWMSVKSDAFVALVKLVGFRKALRAMF